MIESNTVNHRWALFGYGFRPFFLGAGMLAMLLIPWWAASLTWGTSLATAWPPVLWHGHEMLFGFITAAVAGFLLTAVPSWTGSRGFAGWPLRLLAALWLFGRIAVTTSVLWPPYLVAVLDLSFLPALIGFVLPPLLRERNRNTPLLAVLLAFWIVDGTFYCGLFQGDAALSLHALHVGIDIVLLLITIIGGRIVPAFTNSAFKQRGVAIAVRASAFMTPLVIVSMLAVIVIDLYWPDGKLAGVAAAIAAIAHAMRVAQWRGMRTLSMPIVWVLHLGYLWLPVGFALKALSLLAHLVFAAYYLHALTIGAATTMILAVMTRASLGHTGRPLVVARAVALAYVLLAAATLVRVFAPMLHDVSYTHVIVIAALLWTFAFGIFIVIYTPILVRPRKDGKPG